MHSKMKHYYTVTEHITSIPVCGKLTQQFVVMTMYRRDTTLSPF